MRLQLRTGNQTSRYASTDTISGEAYKDLRLWGRWIRARIYIRQEPQCTLGNMVEYGHWIRSAYTEELPPPDERIEQTKRVLVFMPEDLFAVVFMQYVIECEKQFKYCRLGLSRSAYHSKLEKAIKFYDSYKDVDFL